MSCPNCKSLETRVFQLQQEIVDLEERRSRERVRHVNEEQRTFFNSIDGKDISELNQNFIDLLGLVTKIVHDNPNLKGLDSLRSNLDKFKV